MEKEEGVVDVRLSFDDVGEGVASARFLALRMCSLQFRTAI